MAPELKALDPALALFCRTVPKAELHVHIEGTMEPSLMFELAERNNISNMPFKSVAEATSARAFTCLVDFLKQYYAGCDVLVKERDYKDLTAAYLNRAAQDGLKHAEIFFDPQSHLPRGVSWATMLGGMTAAMKEAKEQHGITSHLIACFLRNLGPEAAMETLEGLLANGLDAVVGVGLDSNEIYDDPSPWKPTFEKAKAAGLRLCSHAGEEESAQYVRDVMDMLHVERVDHGVKSVNDAKLLVDLAASQMPLTVCPLSNVRLQVFAGEYEDKLRLLLNSGCCVTINSDDPAFFLTLEDSPTGAYIGYNYEFVAKVGGLDAKAVAELAKNSFRASWISDAEKERLIGAVDEALLASKLG